jgi:hypothetical protein
MCTGGKYLSISKRSKAGGGKISRSSTKPSFSLLITAPEAVLNQIPLTDFNASSSPRALITFRIIISPSDKTIKSISGDLKASSGKMDT